MSRSQTMRASVALALAVACAVSPATASAEDATAPQGAALRSELPPIPEGFEVIDGVAAVVDDRVITLGDVRRAVAQNIRVGLVSEQDHASGDGPGTLSAAERDALEALVNDELERKEARELGITVDPAEVDAELARQRQAAGWTPEEFEKNVVALGFPSLAAYREHVRRELLKQKVRSVAVGARLSVSEADVQRVLDTRYDGGKTEPQVCIHIILLGISPNASRADLDEAQRRAMWLRAQVDAAPERFEDLARRFSDDQATRVRGGAFGCVRRGVLPAELDDAVFSTPVGAVGPVVRTALGFVVFRVDRVDKVPVEDLEALKDRIYGELIEAARTRAYRQWLERLRKKHYVDIRMH